MSAANFKFNPFTDKLDITGPGGGGTGFVQSLTGDTGTAVFPTANNIFVKGGWTTQVDGNPGTSTLTVDPSIHGYPISPLIVGPQWFTGQVTAGYSSISSALNFLNGLFGHFAIYLQSNGFVISENVNYTRTTFSQDLSLIGVCGQTNPGIQGVNILGNATLPDNNDIRFEKIGFTTTSGSAFTGSSPTATGGTIGYLFFKDCTFANTNGYILDLQSWTQPIFFENCGYSNGGTSIDGIINNINGSAAVTISNSILGNGSANTTQFAGNINITDSTIKCPVNFNTGSSFLVKNTIFNNTVTLSGNSTGKFIDCFFDTGALTSLLMNSSANINLINCTISTSKNPSIDGTGTGILTYTDITFLNNNSFSGTLTLGTTSWRPYAIATAASDPKKVGTCSFSSSQFSVDGNGFVQALGSAFNYVFINNAASPYTVTAIDQYIACDTSSGVITIKLPNAPTFKRLFVIKDKTGNASVSNISITTVNGVVTIDGVTTYTLAANFESIQLLFNGTSYEVY